MNREFEIRVAPFPKITCHCAVGGYPKPDKPTRNLTRPAGSFGNTPTTPDLTETAQPQAPPQAGLNKPSLHLLCPSLPSRAPLQFQNSWHALGTGTRVYGIHSRGTSHSCIMYQAPPWFTAAWISSILEKG